MDSFADLKYLICVCLPNLVHFAMNELTVKRLTKIAADDTLFFYFYLSKEIRLDYLCDCTTVGLASD